MTLAALLLLALLLRAPALSGTAILGDEYMQIYAALAHPALDAFLAHIRHNPHHVLLDPLSTWLLARTGESVVWARLPSLLWGLAGVWGLFRLGGRDGRTFLGAAAAAALAVSSMHAEWSVRANFYTAAAALAVWQTILLLELERAPARRGRYALCAAVFLHAHPYAVLVAALHGLRLALEGRRDALKSWAWSWAAAGVAFLPWFLWSTRRAVRFDGLNFWGEAGFSGALRFLAEAPLHLASVSEAAPPGGSAVRLAQLALAAAFAGLWIYSRLPGKDRPESPALSAARLFFPAGLVLVVATDYAFNMYLAPRQLIWVLPFYLLEVAAGAERAAARVPRSAAAVAGALLLAGLICVRAAAVRAQNAEGDQLRRVVAAVADACRPGDVLAFEHDLTAHAFLFHLDRAAFARVPGFRDLPDGLTADCGGGKAEIRIAEEPEAEREAWLFRGRLENFTVTAPPGRLP